MSSHQDLLALCAYGVDRLLSEELISKYGDEYDIPLFELDRTEYTRTMEM